MRESVCSSYLKSNYLVGSACTLLDIDNYNSVFAIHRRRKRRGGGGGGGGGGAGPPII